jgi:hypothetical protein
MSTPKKDFAQVAREESHATFLGEFVQFLRQNRKWWLLPLLLVLLLFGLLMFLSSTAAAPFVYTLF